MKHLLLMLTAFIFIVTTSFAQIVPIPEFSGRPYLLQNNKLTNLERADAQAIAKIKGMGYGGFESSYTVFPGKSEIRFSKGQLPKFLIRVDKDVDPSEAFTVVRATVKKDRRNFLAGGYNMTGSAKDTENVQITMFYKRVREGIYEISMPGNIKPGEYAFLPNNFDTIGPGVKMKVTCFGIDE